ncbi:nuclease-related domain-containing protein, partial [Bhargavaea ullalensis]
MNAHALERLLLRAGQANHFKSEDIEKRLYAIKAGLAGEQKALEYMKKLEFPFPFRVLWDIRLQVSPGQFVQIDLLVITPTRMIIYEVKNIAGRLRFEESPSRLDKVDLNRMITDSYECPVLQLEDEMADLRYWLSCRNIPCFVEGAVVMTANIVVDKPSRNGRVFRLREIRRHLQEERRGMAGRDEKELDD